MRRGLSTRLLASSLLSGQRNIVSTKAMLSRFFLSEDMAIFLQYLVFLLYTAQHLICICHLLNDGFIPRLTVISFQPLEELFFPKKSYNKKPKISIDKSKKIAQKISKI